MLNDESLITQPTGAELELEAPQGTQPQGSDPLDAIEDINALKYIATSLPAFNDEHKERLEAITDRSELLGEVKKIRAISQRKERKSAQSTPPETPAPAPSQEFLTKADFVKSNEKKAVRLATEADADILENWDKVRSFYTPRRGKETPEDILEDIKDAHSLFRIRNPKVEPKDESATELSASTVATPSGIAPAPKTPTQQPPNFRPASTPKDWYKPKK